MNSRCQGQNAGPMCAALLPFGVVCIIASLWVCTYVSYLPLALRALTPLTYLALSPAVSWLTFCRTYMAHLDPQSCVEFEPRETTGGSSFQNLGGVSPTAGK